MKLPSFRFFCRRLTSALRARPSVFPCCSTEDVVMTTAENNLTPGCPSQLVDLPPAQAFHHPKNVVAACSDPWREARASDACATEVSPSLRSNGYTLVPVDDIFAALSTLDRQAKNSPLSGWATRDLRRRKIDELRNLCSIPLRKRYGSPARGGNHAL